MSSRPQGGVEAGIIGGKAVEVTVRNLDKPGEMTPAEAAANSKALDDAEKCGGWGTRIGYVPNGERHDTGGSKFTATDIQYNGIPDDWG